MDESSESENANLFLIINQTNDPIDDIENDYAEHYKNEYCLSHQNMSLANVKTCILYFQNRPQETRLVRRCQTRGIQIQYRIWNGQYSTMSRCRSF